MLLFGKLQRLPGLYFYKNNNYVLVQPSQTVTYTAQRSVDLPPQDTNSILVSENASQTITNKTMSGSSNTFSNIALSSLSALTVSRALASDASGFVSVSATTSTELGYVAGVTSAIQTQINGKQASGNYITALTGDVSASGPGSVSATISAGVVTLSKMASLAANSIIGNNTGSPATPIALTATQATAMLNAMVGDTGSGGTKGLVPAPASGDATKFLNGAGAWASASGATIESLYNTSTSTSANDSTSFATGSTGATVQNITAALFRRVRATTTISDRDLFFFQFDEGNGWQTFGGTVFNGNQNYTNYSMQGSISYGMGGMVRVNTTDINIYFGQYAYANSGSYSSAGSAWSSNGGSTTKWRVMRVSL